MLGSTGKIAFMLLWGHSCQLCPAAALATTMRTFGDAYELRLQGTRAREPFKSLQTFPCRARRSNVEVGVALVR